MRAGSSSANEIVFEWQTTADNADSATWASEVWVFLTGEEGFENLRYVHEERALAGVYHGH